MTRCVIVSDVPRRHIRARRRRVEPPGARPGGQTMTASTTPKISPEFFASMQGKALEAFSVVVEMNHRVLQGLVGLSAATAKEGLRACADLQSATVDSVRTAQAQAAITP